MEHLVENIFFVFCLFMINYQMSIFNNDNFHYRSTDSGVYRCSPNNAPDTKVALHVLTGKVKK